MWRRLSLSRERLRAAPKCRKSQGRAADAYLGNEDPCRRGSDASGLAREPDLRGARPYLHRSPGAASGASSLAALLRPRQAFRQKGGSAERGSALAFPGRSRRRRGVVADDLPLPAIYSSESIKLLETAKSLGIEKKELEERLSLLHEAILESRDASIKNQTTGLYIQSVLYELIHKHYMDEISEPIKFSMLLIHLDQLQSINQRYGKRAGDDALRTAVYLVEQLKDSNCLLFNQFGPGLILFKYGASEMDLKQGALILKRAFSESVLFIEPVTISCAIVSSDEVQAMNIDDRVRNLFDYLERRMNEAKRKGYGEIVGLQETSNVRIEGTILLVDEDPLARNMLLRIFKRIDYEVMIATSVMEAYQAIEKHPIDVVISEINLSKLDGFELKRMLNASIYRNVPFY
ncbi:MAG: response regulator, partial [Synergistales bacterium]|nr:response regulator [Synergistales bacterium]